MHENTATSRLTSKYQTTIPAHVRDALGLEAGDAVAFDIVPGHGVHLRKAGPLDIEFARAVEGTLANEWLSEADAEAYRDL
jgi:AbrB family looped-hinge helix DNA binding protein